VTQGGSHELLLVVEWATIGFFIAATLLFLFFIATRYFLGYMRKLHGRKKRHFAKRLEAGKALNVTVGRSVRSQVTLMAAVNAVEERMLRGNEEAEQCLAVIRKEKLDLSLVTLFRQSYSTAVKLYAISHAPTFRSRRLKPFFQLTLNGKYPFEIKGHAAYGYALLSQDAGDLILLWYAIGQLVEKERCSLKFGEFLARTAMEQVPGEEADDFFRDFLLKQPIEEATLAYIGAVGAEHFRPLQGSLLWLHRRFPSHSRLNTYILRALSLMGVRDCEIILALYRSDSPIVRITIAKVWHDLCPDLELGRLLPYFMDPNFYVARNMIDSLRDNTEGKQRMIRMVMDVHTVDPLLLHRLKIMVHAGDAT